MSTIFVDMLFTVDNLIINFIIKSQDKKLEPWRLKLWAAQTEHPFLILEFNRFFHPGLWRNVISVPTYTQAQRVILSKYKVKVKSTLCSFTTFKIY